MVQSYMLEWLGKRKTLVSAGKNSIWLLLDVVIKKIVGILVGIQVARYLGDELWGVHNYGFVYIGFFSVVASFGIDQLLIRDLTKKEHSEGAILGTAFILKVGGALITSSIAVLLAYLQNGWSVITAVITIVSVGYIFNVFIILDDWFQSRVEAKFPVIARSVSAVLIAGFKVIAMMNHAPVIVFVILSMGEFILGWTLLIPMYLYIKKTFKDWKFNTAYFSQLFRDGLPLTVNSLVSMIGARADQLLLGTLIVSKAALGQYSTAVMIAETAFILASAVINSVFPSVVLAKKESEELFAYRMQLLATTVLWLGGISTIGIALLGPFVILLFFGKTYEVAGTILQIYALSNMGIFWGTIWNSYAVVVNRQDKILLFSVINALLNTVLNILVIPRYGAIGAAFVNGASVSITAIISLFVFDTPKMTSLLWGAIRLKGILWSDGIRPPLIHFGRLRSSLE